MLPEPEVGGNGVVDACGNVACIKALSSTMNKQRLICAKRGSMKAVRMR
jgi:hypothetical protein